MTLEIIDSISVQHQGTTRSVILAVGDLSALSEQDGVHTLVVSAFRDSYWPTPSSLIGALDQRGISLAALAQNKAVDLRSFSSCWLSQVIDQPDACFDRILCFEPAHRGRATEVVGDIFRSIIPFTTGEPPMSHIALPLVAAGDQGASPEEMLKALADAAVHWLSSGMPLDRISIVLRSPPDLESLSRTFAKVKQEYTEPQPAALNFQFDAFVSYSWDNKDAVDRLVEVLKEKQPELRIFVDRLELKPGAAWQQHIFESMDDSRKVICVYSPAYLKSRVCQEEFNMALFRHRESDDGVLLPVYLQTADLPTYMKLVQYHDAREGDPEKITQSAEPLLKSL